MNNAPSFDKTLLGSTQSKVDAPHWDNVIRWWEEKQYRDAIVGVIDYANPELTKKYGNAERTEFNIPHGSVSVNVKVDNDTFSVEAPFLELGAGPKVPVMRQISQLNFSPLNLSSIVMNDGKLIFTFTAPVELCEPFMVYDVLREICLNSDTYDDEFINKFGARRIREPKITPHSQASLDAAWNKIQGYCNEALEYIAYFESKRMYGFSWDVIGITLRKIEYYACPQGYLRTEIERAINDLNSDKPFNDRVARGKEFIQKLIAYDREKFNADMYIAQTFIPYKWRSTLENIKQNYQYANETSAKELANKDYIGATYTIMYAFYNLFYNNNVPDDVAAVVEKALADAAGKPWADAATILRKGLDDVLAGNVTVQKAPENNEKKGSFFSGIFGRN